MSHFCHAEPVEACRDIKHLHSPFDGLRVTLPVELVMVSLSNHTFTLPFGKLRAG